MSNEENVMQPVSDEELAADLYRYRNNKAGSIYRELLELQQWRAAAARGDQQDGHTDPAAMRVGR